MLSRHRHFFIFHAERLSYSTGVCGFTFSPIRVFKLRLGAVAGRPKMAGKRDAFLLFNLSIFHNIEKFDFKFLPFCSVFACVPLPLSSSFSSRRARCLSPLLLTAAGREGLGEVRGRPQAQVLGGRHPSPVQLRPQVEADEHSTKSRGPLLH